MQEGGAVGGEGLGQGRAEFVGVFAAGAAGRPLLEAERAEAEANRSGADLAGLWDRQGMRVVSMCELRQRAAELVLGAMAGEEATITVAGRPSARLVPFARRTWRTYDEIAHLFRGRADPEWGADRDPFDR